MATFAVIDAGGQESSKLVVDDDTGEAVVMPTADEFLQPIRFASKAQALETIHAVGGTVPDLDQ